MEPFVSGGNLPLKSWKGLARKDPKEPEGGRGGCYSAGLPGGTCAPHAPWYLMVSPSHLSQARQAGLAQKGLSGL